MKSARKSSSWGATGGISAWVVVMPRSDIIMAYSAEKKCAQCKEYLFIPDVTQWAYKIPSPGGAHKWFCTWHCLCAWRKKHEKKPKEEKKRWTPTVGTYANNIRTIRERNGITLKQASEHLGYACTTQLINIERGRIPIPAAKIPVLCELLGCTEADIDQRRVNKKNSGLPEE